MPAGRARAHADPALVGGGLLARYFNQRSYLVALLG